jgi:SNF2 family DNA or RNA helicase
LWVGCGLGKTLTVLTAFSKLKKANDTMLVVAPLKIANDVWFSEIEKWLHLNHLSYSIVTGDAKKRKTAVEKQVDIYIINIENVAWLLGYKTKFDWLVVDESTSIKNYASKCFIALSGYRHFFNYGNGRKVKAGLKSDYCILLLGRPTSQGLIDLYSQIWLLDKGERLGKTITEFRDTYFFFDERKYK